MEKPKKKKPDGFGGGGSSWVADRAVCFRCHRRRPLQKPTWNTPKKKEKNEKKRKEIGILFITVPGHFGSHALPSLTEFRARTVHVPGFYRVLLGFTEFYWVLLGFTGFYWVLLGFTGFY